VLEKVGFFDPAFFLYYEEVDLCLRTQKAGYKIMYWPSIKVVHIGGSEQLSAGSNVDTVRDGWRRAGQ
jgi:hypothetical protein